MMRHEGSHRHTRLLRRQAQRGVIHGLVKAMASAASFRGQPLQVFTGFYGCHHQGQHRGIGRDHQVLGQAAFQTQPRHAKGAVLVVEFRVRPVVARFRHAPRHPAGLAILDLLPHRRAAGVVQQGVFVIRHDQQRHQVLEHRAAPGHQHRPAARGDQQPAHRKPVRLPHLAQGNGHVAAQPRLRGEQIVVTRVAAPLPHIEAGAKQIPARVEQKSEIHRRQFLRLPRQQFQGHQALARMLGGFPQALQQFPLFRYDFRGQGSGAWVGCRQTPLHRRADRFLKRRARLQRGD